VYRRTPGAGAGLDDVAWARTMWRRGGRAPNGTEPDLSLRTRLAVLVGVGVLAPVIGVVALVTAALDEPLDTTVWVVAVSAGGVAAAAVYAAVRLFVNRWVGTYVSELEQRREQFRRALEEVGDTLEATHDRRAIVEVVLDTSLLMAGARAAAFFEPSPDGLIARLARGDQSLEGCHLPRGAGVAGLAASTDAPIVWPGPTAPPAAPEPDVAGAVAVPVHARHRIVGVVALYGRLDGGPFGADDLVTLESFVRQAEAAIENTFLHEEASRLSLTDGLTGVWNRRHFDLRVTQELERAMRFEDEPFSLVLCDIDDFKEVNDRLGHQTGDAALVELARRLMESTRTVDFVARYGGEEFALVLPRTGPGDAVTVAEKVRQSVHADPFETDGHSFLLTLSVGVASCPDHGRSVRDLVAAADSALYRAKAGGKNRVEIASASPPDAPPQERQPQERQQGDAS